MHKTESCRVQLNIVDTVMQRTESLSLSPLIMWPDQCILGWRERRGLMMKECVHKPHPLQIQMSFCLKLHFYRSNMQLSPFGTGFVTTTAWERNGTKLVFFSLCGTCVVHQPPSRLLLGTSPKPFQHVLQKRRHESSLSSWRLQMHKLCRFNAWKWEKVTCLQLPDLQEPPETQIWFKHGFLSKQNLGDSAVAFRVTPIREFHLSGSSQRSLRAAEQLLLGESCDDMMSYCSHQCAQALCFDQILTSSVHL